MIEIDEIISNAEYCADVYERMNKAIHPALQVSDYKRYAEDHRQLAGWLKDYKRLKERESCEDWHDIPSGEMTLEQARQAVRELRKYVMDKIEPCKMREATQKEREGIEQYIDSIAEPCEDCINRQAVLKQLKSCLIGGETEYKYVKLHINSIPPVIAKEAEEYQISEDISKGFEEFTKMMFKQGQKESEE